MCRMRMIRRSNWSVSKPGGLLRSSLVLASLALVATACGSTGASTSNGNLHPLTGGDPIGRSGPSKTEDAPAENRTVIIDEGTMQELSEFLRRPTTILGDVLEVDVSRKPFLSASAFRRANSGIDGQGVHDFERGLITITIENNSGTRTELSQLPQLQFENLLLVGVDRLVIRYWTKQTVETPIRFRATAIGNARYLVEEPRRVERGDRLTLSANVVQRGSAYDFVEQLETGR